VDGIIRAVREMTGEYLNIKLWIVGDGPEKSNLKALAAELNISDRVDFCGSRAHSEILNLLKRSDIFVLNSIYEGLPHVVIEAMACRVPVITTNIKGTGEVVIDGETGLLVTPGDVNELKDKLAQLIQSDDLRNRLVANALALVEQKFTWAENLPLLERELESVI
jgi:glycosyltransferase involved in cell wall biosynthesis